MNCPNCGRELDESVKFCPECGTPMASPFAAAPDEAPEWNEAAEAAEAAEAVEESAESVEEAAGSVEAVAEETVGNFVRPAPIESPTAWAPVIDEPAAAEEPETLQANKRSGKKGLLIGLGCLVLAAIVGLGVWLLTRGGNPAKKLLQAAENSAEELKAYTEDLPNLHSILENVESLSDSQTTHLDLENMSAFSFVSGGQQQKIETGVKVSADVDGAGRQVQLDGTYSVSGIEIPFRFYLDETQLQVGSSALLEEGEAVSVPLKDLTKQWNASALARLTNLQLPEDLDLSNLKEADLEAGLKNAYGEDWTTFAQSVEVIRYEGTPHFTDKGTTYSLSWDREALKRMADKTGELDMEELINIEEFSDLQKLDLSDLSAKVVIYILGQCNEHVKELQFFTAQDKLLGVYMLAEDEGENEELELRLAGTQNPWEKIVCTVTTNGKNGKNADVLDVSLKKNEGQLRVEVMTSYVDGDDKEDSWEDGPYVVIYNDADGRIRYEEEGEDVTGDVDLRLVPTDGGFRFSLENNPPSDGDDGFTSFSMKTSYVYALSSKTGSIAPLSAQPIELLKLSEQELEDLVQRIQQKAQSLNPFE